MIELFRATKSKPNFTVEKLMSVYRKEPILHQKILQLKALLYFMEGKGDFLNGITRSSLRTEDNKKFNAANLNIILDSLVKKKLLSKDFNCNSQILHHVTAEAINNQKKGAVSLNELSHFSSYPSHYEFGKSYVRSNQRFAYVAVHTNNPQVFLDEKNTHPENSRQLLNDLTL